MSFDAFLIVMTLISVLSAVFFLLALAADILWPLIAQRRPRSQATYKRT
jgi:hypothetical protein